MSCKIRRMSDDEFAEFYKENIWAQEEGFSLDEFKAIRW
jgi:hypothetical protein